MAIAMGTISLKRLSFVHGQLEAKIVALDAAMSEPIGVTQGLRAAAEQAALYAQGRLSTIEVNNLRLALGWVLITSSQNVEVTKAPAGYSWHEFGLAVDVVPFESSQQPDWDERHPVWKELVSKGEALGLTSGISWNDQPHFQITGRFPATPTDEVRLLFAQGGLQAVWQAAGITA